jgi:Ser/Thr protein kinase RdoA (MazF antagonist)
MEEILLPYSPLIDRAVSKAVNASLNIEVVSIEKMQHGEVNFVYKVVTTDGIVVLRIFRKKFWPTVKRIKIIEELVATLPIPHAKLLFLTDDQTYFPYGFMINEYIHGQNGQDVIDAGTLSFPEFYKKLFKELKRIHNTPVDSFGYLFPESDATYTDARSFLVDNLHDQYQRLKGIEGFDEAFYTQILATLESLLRPLNEKISPVLVHSDPAPANTILSESGDIVLLDWDNACATSFMRDIAWPTYWAVFENSTEKRDVIWKCFLEEYHDTGFTTEELKVLEKIYHISMSFNMLPYYYYEQENYKTFIQVKNRLISMVELQSS